MMRLIFKNAFRRGVMMGFASPFTALSDSPSIDLVRNPFAPRSQAQINAAQWQWHRAADMIHSGWKRVGDALNDSLNKKKTYRG